MMRVMGASGGLYVNISTSTKSDISFVCTYIFIFEYFSRRNVENLKVERGEEVFSSFGVGLYIDLLIYLLLIYHIFCLHLKEALSRPFEACLEVYAGDAQVVSAPEKTWTRPEKMESQTPACSSYSI